ncbi:MAG: hypothetical protein WDM88_07055 [Galbitalea sp.]
MPRRPGTSSPTAGTAALDRLTNVVAGQRTAMAAGITEDDYVTTTRSLERMAVNLGWHDEGQP